MTALSTKQVDFCLEGLHLPRSEARQEKVSAGLGPKAPRDQAKGGAVAAKVYGHLFGLQFDKLDEFVPLFHL